MKSEQQYYDEMAEVCRELAEWTRNNIGPTPNVLVFRDHDAPNLRTPVILRPEQ